MSKTELYDLAQGLGKRIAGPANPIELQSAILEEAKAKAVDPEDLAVFQQFVTGARHMYGVLAGQKLPSELTAARQAASEKTKQAPGSVKQAANPKATA